MNDLIEWDIEVEVMSCQHNTPFLNWITIKKKIIKAYVKS